MAKKTRRKKQSAWTRSQVRELKDHSRAKTPVKRISREMKRTVVALRQKARSLGIGLGHKR